MATDDKKKEKTVIKEMDLQTDGNLLFRTPEEIEEDGEIEEEEPEVFVDEEGTVHRIHTDY